MNREVKTLALDMPTYQMLSSIECLQDPTKCLQIAILPPQEFWNQLATMMNTTFMMLMVTEMIDIIDTLSEEFTEVI